jgi:hypothetical protein
VYYAKIRLDLIAPLRQANANHEDMTSLCLGCRWCVFNHPEASDALRREVSEALLRTGKAHITMACDAMDQVAVTLSDKFVELTHVLASTPESVGVWIAERKSEPTPMHCSERHWPQAHGAACSYPPEAAIGVAKD